MLRAAPAGVGEHPLAGQIELGQGVGRHVDRTDAALGLSGPGGPEVRPNRHAQRVTRLGSGGYDYSDAPGYLLKGGGPLTPQERSELRLLGVRGHLRRVRRRRAS